MPGKCPFCQIVKGEQDAEKIYENDSFLAVLDINPSCPGHTLVIPKKHVTNILELPEAASQDLIGAVKEVIGRLEEGLNAEGFNVGWNHGRAAGQAVPHLHVHVMPRFEDDKGGPVQVLVRNEPEEDISSIAAKVSSKGSPSKQTPDIPQHSAGIPDGEVEEEEEEELKDEIPETKEEDNTDERPEEDGEEEEESEEKEEEDKRNKSTRDKWKEMKKGRY